MTDMKPCPLCGTEDLEGSPFPADRTGKWWRVMCGHPDCNCMVEAETAQAAADRWNRRAAIDPQPK